MTNRKIIKKLQLDYLRRAGGADKRIGTKSLEEIRWTTTQDQTLEQRSLG